MHLITKMVDNVLDVLCDKKSAKGFRTKEAISIRHVKTFSTKR